MMVKRLFQFLFITLLMVNFAKAEQSKIHLLSQKLTDINGQHVSLNSNDFKDIEKTFVMFWGSWCKDCKGKLITTLPGLEKKGKIKVLTVNMDANNQRALKYMSQNKLQVPVYKESSDKSLSSLFKVFAVPHWAVLSRKDTTSDEWVVVDHAPAFESERIAKSLDLSQIE